MPRQPPCRAQEEAGTGSERLCCLEVPAGEILLQHLAQHQGTALLDFTKATSCGAGVSRGHLINVAGSGQKVYLGLHRIPKSFQLDKSLNQIQMFSHH